MLADTLKNHPFFKAMLLAVQEDPVFSIILHKNSGQNSKAAQLVVHFLQSRK